jgi:hypothetical protein
VRYQTAEGSFSTRYQFLSFEIISARFLEIDFHLRNYFGFLPFGIISVDIMTLIFHFRDHVNEIFHLRNYLRGISRDETFALRNHFALSLDIQGPDC